jgi:hypothetical protein
MRASNARVRTTNITWSVHFVRATYLQLLSRNNVAIQTARRGIFMFSFALLRLPLDVEVAQAARTREATASGDQESNQGPSDTR